MNLRTLRQLHRQLAPIIILPFLITAITGVAYRLGKSWFGLSRDQVHFLMVIHEGEYLGKQLEPVYVLLNGLGLLFMLITGIVMWGNSLSKTTWFRALFSRPKKETNE
ncbi:MAG: PepSY domain-containing protein [Lyngbya sp.]|nr:PepSY domain-containing protein [Lyngbya sp.]